VKFPDLYRRLIDVGQFHLRLHFYCYWELNVGFLMVVRNANLVVAGAHVSLPNKRSDLLRLPSQSKVK